MFEISVEVQRPRDAGAEQGPEVQGPVLLLLVPPRLTSIHNVDGMECTLRRASYRIHALYCTFGVIMVHFSFK